MPGPPLHPSFAPCLSACAGSTARAEAGDDDKVLPNGIYFRWGASRAGAEGSAEQSGGRALPKGPLNVLKCSKHLKDRIYEQ
jgi:hypothetical protein